VNVDQRQDVVLSSILSHLMRMDEDGWMDASLCLSRPSVDVDCWEQFYSRW
jgi:hypothetical protein